MAVEITASPNEEGTIVFTVGLKDSTGADIPISSANSAQYQLSDQNGNIINGIDFASSNISSDGTIVLSGDDLALQNESEKGCRILALAFDYDSTYGTGLKANSEYSFEINKLVNIS